MIDRFGLRVASCELRIMNHDLLSTGYLSLVTVQSYPILDFGFWIGDLKKLVIGCDMRDVGYYMLDDGCRIPDTRCLDVGSEEV